MIGWEVDSHRENGCFLRIEDDKTGTVVMLTFKSLPDLREFLMTIVGGVDGLMKESRPNAFSREFPEMFL